MEAGIPKDSAVQYAVSFEENRMDMNMLMDLDKEYLRDLKITALGDIISILKQAKIQHDRLTSARVLNPDSGNSSPSRLAEKIAQEPKSRPASVSVKEDDTGQNIHKRLGPLVGKVKEEASSSVFSRLGDQEDFDRLTDKEKIGSPGQKKTKSAVMEESKSFSSTSRSLPQSAKTGSIFGRLGPETKEATPQEPQVSSSSDSHAHGILKTRQIGVAKTKTLSPLGPTTKKLSIANRLGNQTNIISLKKPLKETSSKRVSFGENEVRNMSTGEVSTDQRPKSPANIQDLRTKLDHENKQTKVTIGGNQLKARPSSSPKNLVIKSRPTPITAPASTTSVAATSARIKPPLESRSSAIGGGLKARIGGIKTPDVGREMLSINSGGVKARIGGHTSTERSRFSTSGGVERVRIASADKGVSQTSSSLNRVPVTPPGAPVRANVHLNPKMIKLQTPQTASTSSAGVSVAAKAKTSINNRIGEKDLQVKLTGDKLKRIVSPAKTAVKRTVARNEEQDDVERDETGTKPKKKRLVMIKTKADGTKTRQVISEDDPILQKVTVTKLRKTASASSMISSSKKSFNDIEDSSPAARRRAVSPSTNRRSISPTVRPTKRRTDISPTVRPTVRRRPVSPESDEDVQPVKDDFTVKIRATTSSSHRTLAGKAMELAVRDEKRAFQGRGAGDNTFLTLANRAKAASLSRDGSLENETDLLPRRNSDHRMRRMSWEDQRLRMSAEDERREEGRSLRMSMEEDARMERLSIEEERMRRISMEEERIEQKLAEHNERDRRLAEEEERGMRLAEEEERGRRMDLEDSRYQMEEGARGRVFQRLGGMGKQRY